MPMIKVPPVPDGLGPVDPEGLGAAAPLVVPDEPQASSRPLTPAAPSRAAPYKNRRRVMFGSTTGSNLGSPCLDGGCGSGRAGPGPRVGGAVATPDGQTG